MKLEKKVGIPKAMLYYTYFPFWYGFFNDLGIEVVLSNNTTKKTISDGLDVEIMEQTFGTVLCKECFEKNKNEMYKKLFENGKF